MNEANVRVVYDRNGREPYPLQVIQVSFEIEEGETGVTIDTDYEISGMVMAVHMKLTALKNAATIVAYEKDDDFTTPLKVIDFTSAGGAQQTRQALAAAEIPIVGTLRFVIADADPEDSGEIYVYVNTQANNESSLSLDTTSIEELVAAQIAETWLVSGDINAIATNILIPVACTIAESGSLSDEIDLGEGRVLCAIDMPADWDAANLTFQASYNSGGTFDDLYDQYGTEKTVTAAADRYIPLDDPAFWLGVRYLKVRSGTAASAVEQTAARTIQLITKPV